MRSVGRFLLISILMAACLAWPQNVADVPASIAMSHVVKANPPIYPDLANMTHIQGRITVRVTISPEGKVTEARMIAGHPIFEASAVDTIKRWKYQPFLVNGAPVPVHTLVYLLFAQGPQARQEQEYLIQEVQCSDLLRTEQLEDVAKSCNAALASAINMPIERFGLKINAYRNAGLAASRLHKNGEAVQDFQERLKLANKELSAESPEWFEVHHDLALALQAAGQPERAEFEYRETEKTLNALSKSSKQDRSNSAQDRVHREQELKSRLQQTLSEHSALLRQMGRTSDADALQQQAQALGSSN